MIIALNIQLDPDIYKIIKERFYYLCTCQVNISVFQVTPQKITPEKNIVHVTTRYVGNYIFNIFFSSENA